MKKDSPIGEPLGEVAFMPDRKVTILSVNKKTSNIFGCPK